MNRIDGARSLPWSAASGVGALCWSPDFSWPALAACAPRPGAPVRGARAAALAADAAEIAIHFQSLPRYMLDLVPGVEPNVLRLGLTEPQVRLATTLNGPDRRAENREFDSKASRHAKYANLIREILKRNPLLFIRGEEAEEAGRLIDPVMNAWSTNDVPMQDYAAGGPAPGPAF